MAKSSNQKLKLLYLLKMLEEKTDEENADHVYTDSFDFKKMNLSIY